MEFHSDEYNKKHTKELLNWLTLEVLSAGGDGDAFWISKYSSLDEILPIVNELNSSEWSNHWNITREEDEITLSNNQECLVITTNRDYNLPSWAQCVIIW